MTHIRTVPILRWVRDLTYTHLPLRQDELKVELKVELKSIFVELVSMFVEMFVIWEKLEDKVLSNNNNYYYGTAFYKNCSHDKGSSNKVFWIATYACTLMVSRGSE